MRRAILQVLLIMCVAGCTSQNAAITEGGSQIEVRQIQTREYDTLDRQGMLRSILATLQDFGFVIDEADYGLGTITATKLQDHHIRMTVTVRERGSDRLAVRANARLNEEPIEDPRAYQDFFAALDKAMFLTLHRADY